MPTKVGNFFLISLKKIEKLYVLNNFGRVGFCPDFSGPALRVISQSNCAAKATSLVCLMPFRAKRALTLFSVQTPAAKTGAYAFLIGGN
ncbi:hypothetical protein DP120_06160 [Planococcus halotolerans]|uniref:Uncharacterized protein n=1 Tax=Planococcus halotolerans TaxID=2233542 RepID=A0A365L2A3_9BACL|nr:hypothetical protein DP120_06160 [Planococcus halotolerans]